MTNDTSTIPPVAPESTGASKTFIASAVVVAAIVILGLVLSLTNVFGGGEETTQPTTEPSSPSTSIETPGTPGEESVCGLDTVEMTGTLNTAPTATWSLVGTTAAPAIEGHGPGLVEADGFRNCYARTPTGALLAAANHSALGSYGPIRQRFYEEAVAPGPGRDALLAKPIPPADTGGTRTQIAGFRVLKYDGNTAEVDLAMRTSNGALAAMVIHLAWAEGDWKLQLADDGTQLSPVVQIPDLNGYILWAGA